MHNTPNPGRRAVLAGAASALSLAGPAAFAPAARAARGVETAVIDPAWVILDQAA